MSPENIYLLALATVLCALNVFLGGPVARELAKFFGRVSAPKSPELQQRADA